MYDATCKLKRKKKMFLYHDVKINKIFRKLSLHRVSPGVIAIFLGSSSFSSVLIRKYVKAPQHNTKKNNLVQVKYLFGY